MCNMSYKNQKYTNHDNNYINDASQSNQLFEPRHNFQSQSVKNDENEIQIQHIKSNIKNPNLKQIENTSMLRK